MDILIKGMEMPSCCEECPFMKKVCDIYFTDKKTGVKTPYHYVDSCSLTGSWFDPFSDDSPKPCPLVALPSHGRLCDLDALIEHETYNIEQALFDSDEVLKDLKNTPVIVEANNGTDS